MNDIRSRIEKDGFALIPKCVSEGSIAAAGKAVDAHEHGVRNLLANHAVRALATSDEVRRSVECVLGEECFAVRGIFFNKNPQTNWKVTWHQDCVIAVREKVEADGWGPWSQKAGVSHVRPKVDILEGMLAIRIHLDDCGADNGPLKVIPGSHRAGILTDKRIQEWPKESACTCSAARGDAILMRPLLLHASSSAIHPSNRRVIHIEFAAHDLPHGLEWFERVGSS